MDCSLFFFFLEIGYHLDIIQEHLQNNCQVLIQMCLLLL